MNVTAEHSGRRVSAETWVAESLRERGWQPIVDPKAPVGWGRETVFAAHLPFVDELRGVPAVVSVHVMDDDVLLVLVTFDLRRAWQTRRCCSQISLCAPVR